MDLIAQALDLHRVCDVAVGLKTIMSRGLSNIDLSTATNDLRPSASFSARKNPQCIPVNTSPGFPGLPPRIWPHLFRLVTKAMSDRLLVGCRKSPLAEQDRYKTNSMNQTNQMNQIDQTNRCQCGLVTNCSCDTVVHRGAGQRRTGGNRMEIRRSRGSPSRD